MSEENSLHIYPHANQQGAPIPFDVIQSISCAKQSFTATPANTIAIPDEAEILVIFSDSDYECYIRLGANISVPGNNTPVAGLYFIPANTFRNIDLNGATTYSIVSASANAGTCHLEFAVRWRDTKNLQQHQRT